MHRIVLAIGMAVIPLAAVVGGEPLTEPKPPTDSSLSFAEFDPPSPVLPHADLVPRLRLAFVEQTRQGGGPLVDLVREARQAGKQPPRPLRAVIYEGRVSNDPQRVETVDRLRDMRTLHQMVWAWRLTDDASLALASMEYMLAWMRACPPSGNDVNDHKLTPLFEAYQAFHPQLDPQSHNLARAWIEQFEQAHVRGIEQAFEQRRAQTNRTSKRVKMLMLAAVVRSDETAVQRAHLAYRRHISIAFQPDGVSHDLRHRDAMHYHLSAVRALIETAAIARTVGLDLLEEQVAENISLRAGLDLIVPYARGERVHAEWINSRVDLDRRRWEAGDPFYEPGRPWNPSDAADVFALATLLDKRYAALAKRLAESSGHKLDPLLWALAALADGENPSKP